MAKSDFTVIEKKKEINRAQLAFAKNIKKKATKHGELTASHQHGGIKVHAYWHKDSEFWWADWKVSPTHSKTPRWWNAFRFLDSNHQYPNRKAGEPNWGRANAMTVQINIPISGNRQGTGSTGGVFVKDSDDEIYIAHTGMIGGGRKGIGKATFVDNFPGTWNQVSGSRGEKDVVIVSQINDPNLIDNVGFFVKAVQKIKDDAKKGKIQKKPKLPRQKSTKLPRQKSSKFNPEREEKRGSYTVKGRIQAELKHAKVINQLNEICEKQGYLVSNSNRYDLLIWRKSKKSLMEAKTDWDSYSRYQAIGQLFYYSSMENLPKNTKLVAVFPKPKKSYTNRQKEFKKVLGKLGIKYITYTWRNKKPKFDSTLDKILKEP